MNIVTIVDRLHDIESTIYDLIFCYGDKADGLENDVRIAVSMTQELRFDLELMAGI